MPVVRRTMLDGQQIRLMPSLMDAAAVQLELEWTATPSQTLTSHVSREYGV